MRECAATHWDAGTPPPSICYSHSQVTMYNRARPTKRPTEHRHAPMTTSWWTGDDVRARRRLQQRSRPQPAAPFRYARRQALTDKQALVRACAVARPHACLLTQPTYCPLARVHPCRRACLPPRARARTPARPPSTLLVKPPTYLRACSRSSAAYRSPARTTLWLPAHLPAMHTSCLHTAPLLRARPLPCYPCTWLATCSPRCVSGRRATAYPPNCIHASLRTYPPQVLCTIYPHP